MEEETGREPSDISVEQHTSTSDEQPGNTSNQQEEVNTPQTDKGVEDSSIPEHEESQEAPETEVLGSADDGEVGAPSSGESGHEEDDSAFPDTQIDIQQVSGLK